MKEREKAKIFRPRLRRGLFIFLILILLWPVFLLLTLGYPYVPKVAFFLNIVILLLLWYTWFSTHFTITKKQLQIEKGPFHKENIKIKDIHKIEEIRQPFSIFSGKKELEIHHGEMGNCTVKPKNYRKFIEELLAQNATIEIVSSETEKAVQ